MNGMTQKLRHIGILLFEDVEELDAIGPWEVLSFWTTTFPQDGYAISCLSRSGGLVRCAKGLLVQAHHSYADAPPLDVLVYPAVAAPALSSTTRLNWSGCVGSALPSR